METPADACLYKNSQLCLNISTIEWTNGRESPTSLHQFEIPIHLPTFYVQQSESLWATVLCTPVVPKKYYLTVAAITLTDRASTYEWVNQC